MLSKKQEFTCLNFKNYSGLRHIEKKVKGERDFPGVPVVRNPPSNAGDASSIPGPGAKIPHAIWQLRLKTTTTEPTHSGTSTLQLRPKIAK